MWDWLLPQGPQPHSVHKEGASGSQRVAHPVSELQPTASILSCLLGALEMVREGDSLGRRLETRTLGSNPGSS